MLKLENISWSTPDRVSVLRDLNLEVPDGKLVVLTGPNGGGKTTLAKIIAGIYKQDSGKIYLDGRDITDVDITERAKMGISFAFQQPVRFKGITVQKLLELSAEVVDAEKMRGVASITHTDFIVARDVFVRLTDVLFLGVGFRHAS